MAEASRLHRLSEASQAVGVHLKVELLLLITTDVHEFRVAKADEVLGRPSGCCHVVDGKSRDVGDAPTNSHDRFTEVSESLNFFIVDEQGQCDYRVDALSHQEILEQRSALFFVVCEPLEREVIASTDQS